MSHCRSSAALQILAVCPGRLHRSPPKQSPTKATARPHDLQSERVAAAGGGAAGMPVQLHISRRHQGGVQGGAPRIRLAVLQDVEAQRQAQALRRGRIQDHHAAQAGARDGQGREGWWNGDWH